MCIMAFFHLENRVLWMVTYGANTTSLLFFFLMCLRFLDWNPTILLGKVIVAISTENVFTVSGPNLDCTVRDIMFELAYCTELQPTTCVSLYCSRHRVGWSAGVCLPQLPLLHDELD